jgi:hypothetical protein
MESYGSTKILSGDQTLWVDAAIAKPPDNAAGLVVRPITDTLQNATVTAVPRSAATVTLAALNVSRRGLMVFNDTGAILYVKFGPGATTADFSFRLTANTLFESNVEYSGLVTGVWGSGGAGNALVTEISF